MSNEQHNLDVLFIASDAAVRSCGWRAGRAAPAPCSPCRGEPALHRTRSDRTARGISRASPGAPRAPDRGSLPESPSSRPVRRHPLADSAGPVHKGRILNGRIAVANRFDDHVETPVVAVVVDISEPVRTARDRGTQPRDSFARPLVPSACPLPFEA